MREGFKVTKCSMAEETLNCKKSNIPISPTSGSHVKPLQLSSVSEHKETEDRYVSHLLFTNKLLYSTEQIMQPKKKNTKSRTQTSGRAELLQSLSIGSHLSIPEQ